jgi:hypothetical protein
MEASSERWFSDFPTECFRPTIMYFVGTRKYQYDALVWRQYVIVEYHSALCSISQISYYLFIVEKEATNSSSGCRRSAASKLLDDFCEGEAVALGSREDVGSWSNATLTTRRRKVDRRIDNRIIIIKIFSIIINR